MAEQTVTYGSRTYTPIVRHDGRIDGLCYVSHKKNKHVLHITVYIACYGPRKGRWTVPTYTMDVSEHTSKEQQLRMQQVALDVVAIRYGREIHLTRPLTQHNPK